MKIPSSSALWISSHCASLAFGLTFLTLPLPHWKMHLYPKMLTIFHGGGELILEKISTEILWQFWVFWLVSCISKREVWSSIRFLYLLVQFRNYTTFLWDFNSCAQLTVWLHDISYEKINKNLCTWQFKEDEWGQLKEKWWWRFM